MSVRTEADRLLDGAVADLTASIEKLGELVHNRDHLHEYREDFRQTLLSVYGDLLVARDRIDP